MKHATFQLLILFSIYFISSNWNIARSQTSEFKLNGLIQNFENGNVSLIDAFTRDTVAKANLQYGSFELSGNLNEYDGFCKPCMLLVEKDDGKHSLSFPIALEPANIICSIDIDKKPIFAGTKNQQKLSNFIKKISQYEEILQNSSMTINKDSLVSELASEVNIFLEENYDDDLKHFGILLTADFIQRALINSLDVKFNKEICSSDSPSIFESYLCNTLQQANEKCIDKKAPLFKSNTDQQLFDLENLVGEKYILIEFWASWCGPCKKQLEELKLIDLEKYDNLSLITISGDTNKNKWKEQTQKFNSKWINLIDTDGSIRKLYNVQAIPLTILIDKNGNVIARNPENLMELIDSIQK